MQSARVMLPFSSESFIQAQQQLARWTSEDEDESRHKQQPAICQLSMNRGCFSPPLDTSNGFDQDEAAKMNAQSQQPDPPGIREIIA